MPIADGAHWQCLNAVVQQHDWRMAWHPPYVCFTVVDHLCNDYYFTDVDCDGHCQL